MKTVYIDSDYKCHVVDDGTMTAVETDYFDEKCDAFIEGYRFVPNGKRWKRADGVIFDGEMITPWKEHSDLEKLQSEYELKMLKEYQEALKVIWG